MKNQQLLTIAIALSYGLHACGSSKSDINSSGGSAGSAGNPTTGGGNSSVAGSSSGAAPGGGATSNAGEGTGGSGNTSGSSSASGSGNGGAGTAGATGDGGASASADTCAFPAGSALAGASVPAGYCAYVWASDLNRPRGVVVDTNGDLLVSDNGRVVLLHDDNGNGVSDDDERVVLVTQAGLNHGIALNGGFLYASTPTTVFRWPYTGNRQPLGNAQQVVTGIPNGGHVTRTLLFDAQGRLYVSVGSGSNLDNDSRRARLIRYPASALGSASTFAQGEVFADGLRNEVGLTLDGQGRVWGVENGRDNLQRQDLGTDIHQNNPGEELNLFLEANAGRFYGYPYCWSEFDLPTTGDGPGTQWADPNNTTHDDAWCKNTTNVLPPVLVMQGHSAPLDVRFYSGNAFPADVVGDAFVTFHGSWNRTTATGYKVVRIPFGADGMPAGDPVPLLESANPGDTDPQWPHRPVSLGIGKSGQLFVSSDASGVIIAVGHQPI